jgi:hypothetical protein
MYNRNTLRFQSDNLADSADTLSFFQDENVAIERTNLAYRLMPADILTHQRYIDAWVSSLRTRYEEDLAVQIDSGIEVDKRAEDQAFALAQQLKFQPGFPDIEIQSGDNGGVVLILDSLPTSRRIMVEIDGDGNQGQVKLIDEQTVYRGQVVFSESARWIRDCVSWLEDE